MRLLIINPNSDHETNRRIEEKLSETFGEWILFDCVCIEEAPKLVASKEGEVASAAAMIKMIREGEDRYDGFVIACHADPNLDVVRTITQKPVVGMAEASYHIAQILGNSFAVICPQVSSVSRKYAQTHRYHCSELMKKVVVAQDDTKDSMRRAAQDAAEPGIDSVVLGCANYTLTDRDLEKRIGIPVIDGVVCAAFIAAGLAIYQQYKSN